MFFQVKQVDADEKGKKITNHQDFAHLDQQRLELHHALQQKVYQKESLILNQTIIVLCFKYLSLSLQKREHHLLVSDNAIL